MKRLLAMALILAGCATAPAPPVTTTTASTAPTTSTAAPTTTTEPGIPFTSLLSLTVTGDHGPAVVLLHGGGWFTGSPADVQGLADSIAEQGAVVFNAPYRLGLQGGGFPATFEDVACAVRFAHARAADFGADPDRLVVVGYSAGAHLGAVAALAADTFDGDCVVPMDDTLPKRFVGLAGPYNTDALAPLVRQFFGTDPAVDPEPWRLGNPLTYLGRNPDLVVRLAHGDSDQTVPVLFSEYFADQLAQAGYDVELTVVPDAGHSDMVADPSIAVGLVFDGS